MDSIVVGYNERDFRVLADLAKKSEKFSGAYDSLKMNSVLLDDGRLTYTELLNRTVTLSNGAPSNLSGFDLPNLAVCYLASFLRRRGFQTEIVNFFNRDKPRFRELLQRGPRCVAITTTFYVEPAPIREIVEFIRSVNDETKIIVGGPFVFNICRQDAVAAQDSAFDSIGADIYINDSQGELTLSRVAAVLRAAGDLSGVPNLIFRLPRGGERPAPEPARLKVYSPRDQGLGIFGRTDREPEANDMNSEGVDWSVLEPELFIPATATRTARSCAYKCSFCTYPEVAGDLSLTDVEVIEKELRYLSDAGVQYVTFIDDTFNVPLPRFKNLMRMLIKNDFGFRWISHLRVGNSDAETVDLMRQAKCMGVFLGIESGDQTVINNMNKVVKVERYAEGIARLHDNGILPFASFIVGFPGETQKSVENTIRFIEKTQPGFYQASLYFHDPSTPIHRRKDELGIKNAAFSWKHDTMDWRTAARSVRTIYSSVTKSVVLPVFGFDFFGLPYFLSKGFSFEDLRRFLTVAQKMMLDSYEDRPVGPLAAGLDSVLKDRQPKAADSISA